MQVMLLDEFLNFMDARKSKKLMKNPCHSIDCTTKISTLQETLPCIPPNDLPSREALKEILPPILPSDELSSHDLKISD
ncbi:hypothetical protein L484_021662 [Morus notabilis]|uniref:Uncharacterized protein n=1 Tax=Morus notabilis TaxID=981085 RepID=W9SEP6_9ROSA|nr:hypothetical protein L484_021662 [Morus notabilis]